MSITTLKCPGYRESNDGKIEPAHPESPETVLLQEIGADINVRCHALIDGKCYASIGTPKQFTGPAGKIMPCYWLSKKA